MLENEKNIMSVEDFMKRYDNAATEQEQHDVVKEIVVNEYVPYLVKKVTLVPAINESVVKNEGMLPYFDETLFEVNYFVCWLLLYTKLNIEDYFYDHSPFDLYDAFCQRGMKQMVVGFININEQTEMDMLVAHLKRSWEKMNRGVENLLYSFYQRLMNVDFSELEKMMEPIENNTTTTK